MVIASSHLENSLAPTALSRIRCCDLAVGDETFKERLSQKGKWGRRRKSKYVQGEEEEAQTGRSGSGTGPGRAALAGTHLPYGGQQTKVWS